MGMRLIDANALKVVLINIANNMQDNGYPSYASAIGEAISVVEHRPTLDYAPVRHGEWVGLEFDGYADGCPVYDLWECSECKGEHKGEYDTLTDYCPNCGATMDGGIC